MRKANNVEYAVAVRDGTDMWLYKTIKRTGRGDIFVFWPFDLKRGGRPHASYHADGRMHIKKEGEMPLKPQHVQKPDASFNGCQSVIVTPISFTETKSWNTLCNTSLYKDAFEIPVSDVSASQHIGHFQLAVDLVGCGQSDLVLKNYKPWSIVGRHEFKDSAPWIVVSLWDIRTINPYGAHSVLG